MLSVLILSCRNSESQLFQILPCSFFLILNFNCIFIILFVVVQDFLYILSFICLFYLFNFFKIFFFIFRKRGKEEERERNINVWLPLACLLMGPWPETQACALIGNRPGDPLFHRPAIIPLSHTSQVTLFFIAVLSYNNIE